MKRQHCARRHVVIGESEHSNPCAFAQKLLARFNAGLEGEVAVGRPMLHRDPRRPECVEEAVVPERCREVIFRSLEEAHLAMAERNQITAERLATRALVDARRGHHLAALLACGIRGDADSGLLQA